MSLSRRSGAVAPAARQARNARWPAPDGPLTCRAPARERCCRTGFFWWWFAYDAYARDIFVEGAYIAAAGGIAAILVAVAISEWRAREAKRVTTYDSARWAETREVRDAWLLGHDGVLLGRWRDEYLRHDGPEHVLCFAPTRSGKGVGLVVPTLLTWPGSAIVHDIKGENLTLTAGGHARFGHGLPFDPTHAQSAAYNPLLKVRCGEWEVRDVQNIADVLVDPEGALEKRNHWEKTSHSPLGGTILHVLYAEPDKTLAGFANSLSDPKRSIETTLRAMMTTPHLNSIGGWADFGVGYAALAAAVVGVWVAAPSLFLAGFLLISALHFSGDPDPRTGGFSRLIYGGAIIVVPALLHRLAP